MVLRAPSILAAIVAASVAALPARAAAQQAAALDTSFMRHLAEMARRRSADLAPPAQQEDRRVVRQYRAALADMDSSHWSDAVASLLAVLQRAPQNPTYRGDLAYAQLRLGHYDQASQEFTRAYQSQQTNGWYVLGIGTVRAAQRQFPDAAGAADLAIQTDSTVLDSVVAVTVGGWFEAAGDVTRALFFARLITQRWPGESAGWLRVASYLASRGDTTPEGLAAIRRYRTLRPDDKLGEALYAKYLYDMGQTDSAIALARAVASDSAFRPFAASVMLQAAGSWLRRDADRTIALLDVGAPWADSSQRAGYANIRGRAQLRKLSVVMDHYQTYPSCDTARVLTTLAAQADSNLRAGLSFDSARTRMMIDTILPPYRGNAEAAQRSCRPEAQLHQQQQQQRPGARPARPRPARPA